MQLFEEGRLGALTVKNRIVLAPMLTSYGNPDGTVSPRELAYYERRARGGAGLLTVSATAVDPQQVTTPYQLKISDDSFIPGLSALAAAIKGHGARASIQLCHPGSDTSARITGVPPVAPSAVVYPVFGDQPHVLAEEELPGIVAQFVAAAQRARRAGFDAVELHAAHGTLLCQFLSPFTNRRQDGYGGDTRRRSRLIVEVVAGIKSTLGRTFPVVVRLSAEEWLDGGINIAESKAVAKLLQAAGADAISVSGGHAVGKSAVQSVLAPLGYLTPLAAQIKRAVRLPVIVAGRINHAKLAEAILHEGKADFIAMGRPLLADPDLPLKAQQDREREVRKCIGCNTCMTFGTGPIACLVNPEVGHEGQTEPAAARSKRVLVLGSGPAGLEAARVALARGHQVTLWDAAPNLGGRWSWLIRPYIWELCRAIEDRGGKIELGKELSPRAVHAFRPDAVIATVGAAPIVPDVPGSGGDNVHLADAVLSGTVKANGQVVVVGAGNAGCEVAEMYRRRGVAVTVLEPSARIAYGLEHAMRQAVSETLLASGARVVCGAELLAIDERRVLFRDRDGARHELEARSVVLALGTKPDQTLAEALAGGDYELHTVPHCEEPRLAWRTAQHGAEAARKL